MGMGIFPSETVCCTAQLQGGSDGGSWWVKQVGNWTCGRHGCSVTTSVARADGERGCHGGLIVLARAHDWVICLVGRANGGTWLVASSQFPAGPDRLILFQHSNAFAHLNQKLRVHKYKTWSLCCWKFSKLGMLIHNFKYNKFPFLAQVHDLSRFWMVNFRSKIPFEYCLNFKGVQTFWQKSQKFHKILSSHAFQEYEFRLAHLRFGVPYKW
jgi:hypothetical protein